MVRCWDAGTGMLVRSIPVAEDNRIDRGGVFAADGATVVVGSGETCRWIDVRSGAEVHRCEIKVPKTDSFACLAPNGEAVVVAGTAPGKDLVLYELPSGRERFRITAQNSWYFQMAFTSDGKTLAALDWNWRDQAQVRLF